MDNEIYIDSKNTSNCTIILQGGVKRVNCHWGPSINNVMQEGDSGLHGRQR